MRSILLVSAFLAMGASSKAQSFMGGASVTASFAQSVTAKCKGDARRWTVADNKITRRYDNGFDYMLIDTAGLFVYVKPKADGKKTPAANAPLEGFFSVDGCGEIYKLNYYTLKKFLRGETDFLKAVKAMEDKDLFTAAGKTTKVNELYKKLVSTVNE